MSVKNISHQEIHVPQGTNPLQVIEFYHQLGFQTIPHPFPQQSLASLTEECPKVDAWLSLPPSGNRNQDWLIRIVSKETEAGQSSSGSKLHYTVGSIKKIITVLQNLGVAHDVKDNVVETSDPTGQALVFSEVTHPFSTKIKEPSKVDSDSSVDTSSLNLVSHNRNGGPKKKIAVLTSGGDSQGMNCAVRSIARAAISKGCEAYAVWEGYQGLVDGGDKIVKLTWGEVRRYISVSGTIIGSARCKAFRTFEGRLKAAENLVLNGIDALIVIGGDGSLTGADLFRSEWPTLLAALVEQSRITQEQADTYKHLNIAGLVGSIDNDMAGTDITIGAVSSLHRICESVDNIISTALSHQRAFVIEVMGRHCGWLALMAAVCCGADWVFIPEKPAKHGEWQKQMCETVKHHRELGRRCSIIIVCEGAIDDELNPIKLDDVASALTEHLQMDSRTTSLGHVQRGGNPSAMDRIVGAVQGIIAVQQILEATPETPSPMIGIVENHFTSTSLMDAVATTKKVAENVEQKNFKEAFALRDPEFIDMWQAYKSGLFVAPESRKEVKRSLRIAIMNIGAPAAGMNAVTKTVVRLAMNGGHKPIAIMNGIPGLIRGEFKDLNWLQVDNWMNRGGSELGTNRKLPETDYGMVAYQLQRHGIDALLVVGGFEAYHAVTQLTENRKTYPIFNIPIACIPATISNNVPGTAYSLGSDTSLNAITEACDRITQSAAASHRRVFIVELHGGRSGYLATMAGLCVGASRVYTPEEGISLKSLQQDVEHMKDKFRGDSIRNDTKYHVGRLILRTETCSKTYTTNLISNVFQTESEGLFDSRTAVLGHIQQGGTTAPMDRVRGCRYGYHAFVWLEEMALQNINADGNVYAPFDESACVIGAVRGQLSYSPISSLQSITDWEFRRPTKNWWDEFPQYNKMLAHYPSSL